jgi:hypothetical protein
MKKYNQKDYKYYVWIPGEEKIVSGWEYREDAKDSLEDLPPSLKRVAKVSAKSHVAGYVDVGNNENWEGIVADDTRSNGKKSRRNPQPASFLEYDVVSRRCAHDTPLGETCLECEEEAEYDLETSAPGRWRERSFPHTKEVSEAWGKGTRRNGKPHMSMTFGHFPTKQQWDAHWEAHADSPYYDISMGRGPSARAAEARLHLDGSYDRDQLWKKVHELYNIADSEDDYDGDDSAASWASDIMGTLGFEWI